jgi:hypothetical protein
MHNFTSLSHSHQVQKGEYFKKKMFKVYCNKRKIGEEDNLGPNWPNTKIGAKAKFIGLLFLFVN